MQSTPDGAVTWTGPGRLVRVEASEEQAPKPEAPVWLALPRVMPAVGEAADCGCSQGRA